MWHWSFPWQHIMHEKETDEDWYRDDRYIIVKRKKQPNPAAPSKEVPTTTWAAEAASAGKAKPTRQTAGTSSYAWPQDSSPSLRYVWNINFFCKRHPSISIKRTAIHNIKMPCTNARLLLKILLVCLLCTISLSRSRAYPTQCHLPRRSKQPHGRQRQHRLTRPKQPGSQQVFILHLTQDSCPFNELCVIKFFKTGIPAL